MPNAKSSILNTNLFTRLFVLILYIALSKNILAQPFLALNPVIVSGLSSPIQFVHAGDGSNRIFIVQQGATIRAYNAAFNFLGVFLTVSNVNVGGERGLLSMVFHPDYQNNGLFYVYYTNTIGDLEIARYHVSSDPNMADPASKVIVITIPHPTNSNHNGGELHFGTDGYLYASTGDGGGGGDVLNNAQNTSLLLGKILRLNVNTAALAPFYTIPSGNPFGNEIFALGLRNPFRWSFDRQTQDMWIGDVGQDSFEEINFRAAANTLAGNYGWRCYEGNNTYNPSGCGSIANYVFPVLTYPTQNPLAAVTGGIVYRGAGYPSLQGYNISADFYSGTFYLTISNGAGGWNTTTQILSPTGIVDFGETEAGEAFVVSLTGNSVYRVVTTGVVPVILADFNATAANAGVALNWKTLREENIKHFDIEYSLIGNSFMNAGTVLPHNSTTSFVYNFKHNYTYEGPVFYRLKIINNDGSFKYSAVIKVLLNNTSKKIVVPSFINNGVLNVNLPNLAYNTIEVISINGNIILQKNIVGQTGNIKIPVNKLSAGAYMVRLTGNTITAVQKIFIQ